MARLSRRLWGGTSLTTAAKEARQELADLVFAETRHLVPRGFSTPSVVVYGQKESGGWSFGFFRKVTSKILKYRTGHCSVPVAIIFGLNWCWCEPSNPW